MDLLDYSKDTVQANQLKPSPIITDAARLARQVRHLSLADFYQLLKSHILKASPHSQSLLQYYVRRCSTRVTSVSNMKQKREKKEMTQVFRECILAVRKQANSNNLQEYLQHIPNKDKVNIALSFLSNDLIIQELALRLDQSKVAHSVTPQPLRLKEKSRQEPGFYTTREMAEFQKQFSNSKKNRYYGMQKSLMEELTAREIDFERQIQKSKKACRLKQASSPNQAIRNRRQRLSHK